MNEAGGGTGQRALGEFVFDLLRGCVVRSSSLSRVYQAL